MMTLLMHMRIIVALAVMLAGGLISLSVFASEENPPRLVIDPDNPGNILWENASAFGEVPSDKLARGRFVCAALNNGESRFIPTGYHAHAMDLNGNKLKGGGFFCSEDESVTEDTPPRLLVDPDNKSHAVWDSSAAFDPVPDEKIEQGRVVCRTLNNKGITYVPQGYHPLAQDSEGNIFPDGAFFCVPGDDPELVAEKKPVTKPVPVEVKEVPKPVKQPKAQRAKSWIMTQSPGNYTIQLIAARDRQAIMTFLSNNPSLKDYHIVETIVKGQSWVTLLSGNYQSYDAAYMAFERLPHDILKLDPWVRSIKSVQKVALP